MYKENTKMYTDYAKIYKEYTKMYTVLCTKSVHVIHDNFQQQYVVSIQIVLCKLCSWGVRL